ncbi:MAG: hypothetical protein ACK5MT_17430 [Actinomycetales bacterium]
MSARILPWDFSTHSSTLARNGSIVLTRRTGSTGTMPASRAATYRCTV